MESAVRPPDSVEVHDEVPRLSVLIPVLDERGALPGLLDELDAVCSELDGGYELVVVDDGSTDGSGEYLEARARADPELIVVRLARTYGKTAALDTGFQRTSGLAVVTLDGDGQDDPHEIPALLSRLSDGYDIVSGWKRDRQDPATRRWASQLFNRITALLSGVRLHDFNCGLKAYRGDAIRSLRIYGELHRFIPVLGSQRGWRVSEVEVAHRPRAHGTTKFGLERYARGLLDLVTVLFMGRYQQRPLHLFGGVGMLFLASGTIIGLWLTIEWIGGEAIGGRPLLLLGVLLILVGMQFITFGLLAQMIVAARYEGVDRTDRDDPADLADITPERGRK